METRAILWPMLVLIGWTMTVMLMIAYRRFSARVHPREFRLGESAAVPPHVQLPNRNFMNLLEIPVLFYVVTLTLYVTGTVTPAAVALAWAFVGFRIIHSFIHLSYNNVFHRLLAFAFANFALLGMWVGLMLKL